MPNLPPITESFCTMASLSPSQECIAGPAALYWLANLHSLLSHNKAASELLLLVCYVVLTQHLTRNSKHILKGALAFAIAGLSPSPAAPSAFLSTLPSAAPVALPAGASAAAAVAAPLVTPVAAPSAAPSAAWGWAAVLHLLRAVFQQTIGLHSRDGALTTVQRLLLL